ncbi:MAG: hypothetical protein ABIQ18_04060 [Umezawaea sp.]
MRKLFGVFALALSITLGAPLVAAAAPAEVEPQHWFWNLSNGTSTTNLVTERFATPVGATELRYWCSPVSGNTRVQLVSPNQLTAYRDFPAICDNQTHDLGSLAVGSNTAMRARIHNYSGQRFNGFVQGGCPTCYPVGA